MSQRLTRKEMKQKDQFLTSMESTLDYGKSHLKPILLGAGGLVGVVILGVLVTAYMRHRTELAGEALHEAVQTLDAPVTGLDSAEGEDLTFADEASRRAKARELLEEVQASFGSSDSADLANLYLAKLAAEEGDLATAQDLWTKYSKGAEKSIVAAQVQMNLLALERQQEGAAAVVDRLKEMLESDSSVLPDDVVLFELGSALEELSREEEALPYFQRIVDEFPRSQYSFDARQKTTQLADAAPQAG